MEMLPVRLEGPSGMVLRITACLVTTYDVILVTTVH